MGEHIGKFSDQVHSNFTKSVIAEVLAGREEKLGQTVLLEFWSYCDQVDQRFCGVFFHRLVGQDQDFQDRVEVPSSALRVFLDDEADLRIEL